MDKALDVKEVDNLGGNKALTLISSFVHFVQVKSLRILDFTTTHLEMGVRCSFITFMV